MGRLRARLSASRAPSAVAEIVKLSVAIPTRNGSRYLPETFASILSQSRLPDELVISDDASKDDTVEIAEAFARTTPFRVKILAHTPSGITANYLNALGSTTGDVIVFSDQDDVWLHNKLESIEKTFLSSAEISIVSSDSSIVDKELRPSGKTLRGDIAKSKRLSARVNAGEDLEHFIRGLPLLAHTLAIRAQCRSIVLNKPERPIDWWFENWVSMAALSVGKLALLPDALTLYRQHAAQVVGAPAASRLPKVTTADYLDRADRFMCLATMMRATTTNSLLDADEVDRRAKLIEAYVLFLANRSRVLQLPKYQRLNAMANASMFRDYRRFASGVKSFARDILC